VSFWEALVLGGVQGATEFLPVSSSGHLVIFEALMGLSLPGVSFEIAVHVATLVSVLLVYRGRVARLVTGALGRDPDAWRYLGLLALATVPAALVGVLLGDAVRVLFDVPAVAGVALLVTGGLLWSIRGILRRERGADGVAEATASRVAPGIAHGLTVPSVSQAVLMGLAQAFALIPGISRSGTTVVVGLWVGVEATEAAAFSFLMAVPAIAGAAILQLLVAPSGGANGDLPVLAAAFVTAAVVGVLAIRAFVALLAHRSFHRFALYCWVAGGSFLLWLGLV
jgi:undecaprenyl-diphosphatase